MNTASLIAAAVEPPGCFHNRAASPIRPSDPNAEGQEGCALRARALAVVKSNGGVRGCGEPLQSKLCASAPLFKDGRVSGRIFLQRS